MSWSLCLIGQPEDFPQALDKIGDGLTGESKAEFEEAKPNLLGLIAMNFNKVNPTAPLQVTASGHASKKDGVANYSQCVVEIKPLQGRLIAPTAVEAAATP